jgi:tetratricopeptide (TPR) repeat protein
MYPLSIDYFEFSLKSRRRSGLFLFLAALVTFVGSAEAIKIAAVTALGKSAEVSKVQEALALDPDNPVLHDQLGQLYANSVGLSDLVEGVAQERRATALNPYKADYWLALASACESVRDNQCAGQAQQRALVLSPMVPMVWWVAGNHYLRTGRPEAALPCFHRLLELSPDYAAPTFGLMLRAYRDPKMILEKVVGEEKDPQLALAFADFMSANNQFDAAHQAWTQIANSGSPFPFAAVRPYLERLLGRGRYQEARAVWLHLEERGVIAKLADGEQGNLVFNGGFEQSPLDAGFDWRSEASPYVSVDFADASPFAGRHCLRVDFPVGQNDEFEPVNQIVPVVPNQAYTLEAYVRSRDITSDSGPRLRVTDPGCPRCLNAWTDVTVGNTSWHRVTLRFSAGPQTQAVRVSVWRPRSRSFPMEISGSFWLDSVSVREETNSSPPQMRRGLRGGADQRMQESDYGIMHPGG